MARDPYDRTPNTGIMAMPIWKHTTAPCGYSPSRTPMVSALTRWGTGVTVCHPDRMHPVPIFKTGRFHRIASPPATPGRVVGEGNVTSYGG